MIDILIDFILLKCKLLSTSREWQEKNRKNQENNYNVWIS